jgi:ribonuclease BN (tRNA processing enzyme)
MKITILGCWGVGTIGETTSFLVEIEDVTLLIDAGIAPARQLKQIGRVLPEVSHTLISHVHADHLQGLPYALFVRGVQERTFGKVPLMKVISHKEGITTAKKLCELLYPDRTPQAEWIEIEKGQEMKLSELVKLKALPVNHTVTCFAYRIESSNFSLTFTADTLPTDELIEFAKGSDLLIQECFGTTLDFAVASEQLKHSLSSHAGEVAKKTNAKNLLIFHMHEKYFKLENRQPIIDEISSNYKGNIIFPDDLKSYEF